MQDRVEAADSGPGSADIVTALVELVVEGEPPSPRGQRGDVNAAVRPVSSEALINFGVITCKWQKAHQPDRAVHMSHPGPPEPALGIERES
ncbi:hypothetical protein DT019_20740 [Streptomyces sp. SDr-06]|uniref:hypothetical protein n=1 Tax=Streptomyces sp. SDr-06 TaxID=2267702 RepID=UPI000DE8F726|nr:hypothetical protein [Streptomyces sp. SDr-06]RCH66585.1 hypothetical protein DT019_20740 [Streptomyces sp. SDr-06]